MGQKYYRAHFKVDGYAEVYADTPEEAQEYIQESISQFDDIDLEVTEINGTEVFEAEEVD